MNTSRLPLLFAAMCFVWLLLMTLVVPVDYDWTLMLRQHRIRWLDHFMDRTIFEGEPIGGGDPVVLVILLAAGAYYLAWKFRAASRFYAWRPQLGFLLTSALICSVMMVHSLKWVMGRARPVLVVKDKFAFSDWFVFGPHFITEGTYRGSFPSGHVAQAFVLVSIAYALAASASQSRMRRLAGWLWGLAACGYAALMGISRCMTLSHWLSDVVGAFGLSWILMHAIYFWLLRIPEQAAYFKRSGRHPVGPVVWELRLCVHLAGMVLGGMAVLLGIRAWLLEAAGAFYLLIPTGAALLVLFYRRFQSLRHRAVNNVLCRQDP